MDKKGQGVGFTWILTILFLFLLGVAYVLFNQVLTVEVLPLSNDLIASSPYLNTTEVEDIQNENNKYMAFWHSMPFIIVFLLVIYAIVTGFRKGNDNE